MVFERTVDAVGPQLGKLAIDLRATSGWGDLHGTLGGEPIRQREAQAFTLRIERLDVEWPGHQGRTEGCRMRDILRPDSGLRRCIPDESVGIDRLRQVQLVGEEDGMQDEREIQSGLRRGSIPAHCQRREAHRRDRAKYLPP